MQKKETCIHLSPTWHQTVSYLVLLVPRPMRGVLLTVENSGACPLASANDTAAWGSSRQKLHTQGRTLICETLAAFLGAGSPRAWVQSEAARPPFPQPPTVSGRVACVSVQSRQTCGALSPLESAPASDGRPQLPAPGCGPLAWRLFTISRQPWSCSTSFLPSLSSSI